jgi:high-affinity iron transporter
VVAGVLGAAVVAAFAGSLSQALAGAGQEVFQSAILLVAVVMLGWHTLWMARHGREMAAHLSAVGAEVMGGRRSLAALGVVVAVAVMREGSEVVLFLYGVAVSSHQGWPAMAAGAAGGVLAGVLVSLALFRGLVAIPVRHLFRVTNSLIAVMAAGMAGQAAAILAGVEVIPSLGEGVWDSSFLVSEDGLAGRTLKALVGYSAQPSGVQLLAWGVTLATLVTLSRRIRRQTV